MNKPKALHLRCVLTPFRIVESKPGIVKYVKFLMALDLLARHYPKYHSHELLTLADDIWKWINNELPEDSSSLAYLRKYFDSPAEAFRAVWREIQLRAGPFLNPN